MQQLTSNERSPSYVTESNKYLSFCVSALMLSVSSVAIMNAPDGDMLPSTNCRHIWKNDTGEYDSVIPLDFVATQVYDDLDKENAEAFSEFFIKLTANMKTLPFEAFEDIAQRPWDFV